MKKPLRLTIVLLAGLSTPLLSAESAAPARQEKRPMAFDISMVDQTPVPRTQARPAYPRVAGAAGEKRVVVDFIVGVDGKVSGANAIGVADTEVDRAFAQAATEAVQKWTFKPGRKGGRDVAVHMRVPIVFKR